jgi:hypothetical protein
VVLEQGSQGELSSVLASAGDPFAGGEVVPPGSTQDLALALDQLQFRHQAQVGLGLSLVREGNVNRLRLLLHTPDGRSDVERTYGGPAVNASAWARNLALDRLRRKLTAKPGHN